MPVFQDLKLVVMEGFSGVRSQLESGQATHIEYDAQPLALMHYDA
jgi:hypothetical protein